ncbi:site-specific integrase, partial [Streptomyces nigra]
MTSTATHVGSSFVPRVTSMVGAEELKLMSRFPHRERPSTWEATAVTREEVLERLARPPLRAVEPSAQANRMFGARLLLDWLMTFPGETWQQRWQESPAHGQHIASQGWRDAFAAWARPEGRVSRRETLLVGVLALLCADAVRPDPEFLIGSRSRHLRPALETTRDPEGFARLRASLPNNISAANISSGLKTIAEIMACRGGASEDIVVGDLLLWQSKNPRNSNGRIQLAYTWLRDLGLFPADAPHTLFRISNRTGQLTPADLVDRYELQCRPIRDLLIAYLSHRSVGLDFTTLQALRFWGDLERHHPGIDSLRLPAEVKTTGRTMLSRACVYFIGF